MSQARSRFGRGGRTDAGPGRLWSAAGSSWSTTWSPRARRWRPVRPPSAVLVPWPSARSRSPGSDDHREEAGRGGAYTRSQAVHDATLAPPRRDQNGRPEARGVRLRTIVKGKNVDVPDRVREYAERKLKRIDRLLDDQTDATVELWSEHHKSAATSHVAEVTLIVDGQTLRSRATGTSYQDALDDVVDKAERIAVDYKEKPRLRARPEEEKQILRRLADGSAGPGREPRIVKVKRFAIEPMFEEDAVARDGRARPPVLRLRQRRDRARRHPLPPPGRRLRPHRASHRRRLHQRAAPEPRPPHQKTASARSWPLELDSGRRTVVPDAPTPARQALPLGAAP